MSERRYYARVRVTFDMECDSGPWGKTTTIDQVVKDVLRAAEIQASKMTTREPRLRFVALGEPTVQLEKPR